MKTLKKNILMLDDDLAPLSEGVTEERMRLQPWLRWLKLPEQEKKFSLIESKDLKTFIAAMEKRKSATSSSDDYIHGIIIDVMWKKTTVSEENFKIINYPDVKVNPLEAGIQLLLLIFKPDSAVPQSLLAHKNRKIAVLSSLRGVEFTMDNFANNVTILHKKTETAPANEPNKIIQVPDESFKNWVAGL